MTLSLSLLLEPKLPLILDFFFEGSTGGEDPPPEIIPLYLAHDGRIEKFYKCFVALHC